MTHPIAVAGEIVGRTRELEAIAAVLEGAHSRCAPAVVTVVGDPGIGKTRLISEVATAAAGVCVLRLIGFESERLVPLGAAASVLRELMKVGVAGEQLAALLAVDSAAPAGLESMRVFEAAYRVVASMAPALLVLDDLQWMDELSRAFVHYVLRAAQADEVALAAVCGARPAPEAMTFLRSMRELFADATAFVEITLGPLDRAAGSRLAQLVDPRLDEAAAVQLWATGGGSPFWIETAARAGAVPERPAAVIATTLRELGPDAAAALAALVVAARPADVAELSGVLTWPPTRTGQALAELVNRGLTLGTGELFRTAHDLVRQAALAQLPEDQLRRLHTGFAGDLRRRAGGQLQLLMEALEHADAAGVATVELALEIARSAQRRLLGLAGLARLAVIAERPTTDASATLALQVELAAMAEELSHHEAACDRFAALAASLPTAQERARAAVSAAQNAIEIDRPEQAAGLLARARKDGADDPWTLVAADALDYHRLVWLVHDATSARPYLERASSRARELVRMAGSVEELAGPARQAYVEVVDAERVARVMDDDILGMLALSDELIEATRGLGERHLEAKLFTFNALRFLNRWPAAEARTKEAMREARQQIYPGVVAYGAYELALAVYMQGRIAEAAELYAEARRLGARIDTSMTVGDTWLPGLGPIIDASLTDWRRALQSLREEAERQANPHCRLAVLQRAAMCLARFAPRESREAVVELLVAADADGVAADCVRCLWELRVVSAELYARVGEIGRAVSLLEQWDATHPATHPRATFLRARSGAFLAAATGQADGVDRLREAARSAADAGLLLDQVWSLLDLGNALVGSDRESAVESWTAAAQLAGDLGAASEEALARSRLRAAGVRRPSAPRAAGAEHGLAALSQRELDVTRLAAAGARNSDIAESLFISAKTVEQHLSRIFAKLGVRNRTELGARYAAATTTATPPVPEE
jgi:DNA-binding CsgD family transcriptional regulator